MLDIHQQLYLKTFFFKKEINEKPPRKPAEIVYMGEAD